MNNRKKILSISLLILFFSIQNIFASQNLKIGKDYVVTENLRLKTSKNNGNKIVCVLKAGAKVRVLKIGEKEVIDEIESNWVFVEVQKDAKNIKDEVVKYGVVGWCFAGYLANTNQSKNIPNYANANGSIISTSDNIIKRKHIQNITIGDLAEESERIVYSDVNESKILYTLQDNDEIQIKEIWYIKNSENEKAFVNIKVKDFNGFIKLLNDPYENNQFEILEKITVGKKTWTVRKLQQMFAVWSKTDSVELRDAPGIEGTNVIGQVPVSYKNGNNQINLEIEAITEEKDLLQTNNYWVRLTYDGKTGWVYGKYLSAERGGPQYLIPNDVLDFEFGWY